MDLVVVGSSPSTSGHFKVGNMSRDKTEYQVSKIGHVQHSRLVLRHSIQMILYGRIIDYY